MPLRPGDVEDGAEPGAAAVVHPPGADPTTAPDASSPQGPWYQVLDLAPVPMALTDTAGAISWANAAFARLVGHAPPELTGTAMAALVHPDDHQRDLALATEVGTGERDGHQVLQRWVRGDGTEMTVSVRVSRLTDPTGAPLRLGPSDRPTLVRQVLDVTERLEDQEALARTHRELQRRNNELERSNSELAEFAFVVSHDVSEPLRVIAGHAQLLSRRYDGQLDETAQRWLDFIVDGCARMRSLIDDVLLYSRAGQPAERGELVGCAALVEQAIASIDDARAAVRVGPLPDVALPLAFGQVFANLIGNAIKFAGPETATAVRVEGHAEAEDWSFVVADNGPGIPERHRERVFKLFQRLQPREDAPGSGLGLAICRKVVTRHGGRLWVEDASEGGAALCFTVPRADQGEP